MAEQWNFNEDKTSATITGREAIPVAKKANPSWWLANDQEPEPEPWYMPGKPYWLRKAMWYVRNPLQNLTSYVWGVEDKNYTVQSHTDLPADVIYRNDVGQSGWQRTTITLPSGIKLPFVSYSTATKQIGFGWQPNGHFQVKINL